MAIGLPCDTRGTVTFLFTDLEGCTRLWEEHPDAMRVALARHEVPLTTWLAVEFVSGQRAGPSVRRRRSESGDEPDAPRPVEAADRDERDFWN